MMSKFGQLTISRVIVHVVPRALKNDPDAPGLQLSEADCDLAEDAQNHLQAVFRGLLADSGREVMEDVDTASKIPGVVRQFLQKAGPGFVPSSQEMAHALREAQSGANSGGLLLVAECKLGRSLAVLLAKIEQETGMRASFTTVNGQKTFDMEFLKDLFFTNRSKVYKAGLFSAADLHGDQIRGWAADKQLSGTKIADFFLRSYLGCTHLEKPEELTRRFYEESQEWINREVAEPDLKTQYSMALVAELQSPRATLSASDFAKRNLHLAHRDEYLAYLRSKNVPSAPVEKSVGLVADRLQKFSIAFASGVTMSIPRTALDNEIVRIERIAGNRGRVTVVDEMGDIKGRSVPGRKAQSAE
ncbi:nucleoid-associated protein [Dactylosporangium sp. CA-233914]|uniref:nucleoid-associated protein n=1 Tax=Dactylosporangium sp. CA-233914 TaxID=3239934 RepID=UPI003D91CE85